MPRRALHVDATIFGGGIAGLWTLARLGRAGVRAVLLEAAALGEGQTVGSQGIIHGGVKYALTGEAGRAAAAIAEMPRRWRDCLRGRGELDLGGASILSEHQYLWTTPGLVSRVAGLGASKVLRTPVRAVPREERPSVFGGAPRGVDVYRVDEPVLDVPSLLGALRASLVGRLVKIDWPGGVRFGAGRGELREVRVALPGGEEGVIRTRWIILAAGAGNEELLRVVGGAEETEGGEGGDGGEELIGVGRVRTQRRPLHMVMARGAPAPLFGHCLGASSLPRITVTTGRAECGELVWYIGGAIAEAGVERGREAQIEAAQREVGACLPWVDRSALHWATWRIDRAEGVPISAGGGGSPGGAPTGRPDGPVVARSGRTIAAWPTKLAFAPALADRVLSVIGGESRTGAPAADPPAPDGWPIPEVATPPWRVEGVVWT